MERHLGFNWKFGGQTRTHLMDFCFNDRGRFIKLLEFATNQRTKTMAIPEGDKGRGEELLGKVIFQ